MARAIPLPTQSVRGEIVSVLRKAGASGLTREHLKNKVVSDLKKRGYTDRGHFGQALDFQDPAIPVDYIDGVYYHRDFSPA
jgi:hypothetical protein